MTTRILRPDAGTDRPYVPGLLTNGDLIFVSGQIPLRDGRIVDDSIEHQVEVVFFNIKAVLADAGASLDDIVRCGLYLTDLDALPRINQAYEQALGSHRPTRTTVGVTLPGYDVEVDCIAVVPTGTTTNAAAPHPTT